MLEKRRPYWARVDELVARTERAESRLKSPRVARAAVLYRKQRRIYDVREDPSSQRLLNP